jgi:hypothetical protein
MEPTPNQTTKSEQDQSSHREKAPLEDQTTQMSTADAETISEEPPCDSAPKQDDLTSKNSSTENSEADKTTQQSLSNSPANRDKESSSDNSTDHDVFYTFLEVLTCQKHDDWYDGVPAYAEELRTALCNIDKRMTKKGSVLGPEFRDMFDRLDLAKSKLACSSIDEHLQGSSYRCTFNDSRNVLSTLQKMMDCMSDIDLVIARATVFQLLQEQVFHLGEDIIRTWTKCYKMLKLCYKLGIQMKGYEGTRPELFHNQMQTRIANLRAELRSAEDILSRMRNDEALEASPISAVFCKHKLEAAVREQDDQIRELQCTLFMFHYQIRDMRALKNQPNSWNGSKLSTILEWANQLLDRHQELEASGHSVTEEAIRLRKLCSRLRKLRKTIPEAENREIEIHDAHEFSPQTRRDRIE